MFVVYLPLGSSCILYLVFLFISCLLYLQDQAELPTNSNRSRRWSGRRVCLFTCLLFIVPLIACPCFFYLQNQAELSANSDWSRRWSGRRVCLFTCLLFIVPLIACPCFFYLQNQAELSANSDWSRRWSRRLICWCDVPVARHPGQWPDCDCD